MSSWRRAVEHHLEEEERLCLPYLDPRERAWLLAAHAKLRADGFPRAAVLAHAEEEMPLLRRRCPPKVLRHIEHEHAGLAELAAA